MTLIIQKESLLYYLAILTQSQSNIYRILHVSFLYQHEWYQLCMRAMILHECFGQNSLFFLLFGRAAQRRPRRGPNSRKNNEFWPKHECNIIARVQSWYHECWYKKETCSFLYIRPFSLLQTNWHLMSEIRSFDGLFCLFLASVQNNIIYYMGGGVIY